MALHGWISFYLKNLLEEYPEFFGGDRNSIMEYLTSVSDMESEIIGQEEIHRVPTIFLQKLEFILHETEDILDLHRYREIEQDYQVKYGNQIKAPLLSQPLFRTIGKITKNLLGCLSYARDLCLMMGFEHNQVDIVRKTDSLISSRKIIGLDKKLEHILKLLGSESFSSRNYSVVAIVGKQGIGKTTLAKLIYNHESLEKDFERRIWVYASHKFDLVECTQRIAGCLSRKDCRMKNLDVIQQIIKDRVQGKRVLLVLDDVLYRGLAGDTSIIEQMLEDEMQWEQLLAPIASCGKGSLILVTSRSDRLPLALRSSDCIKLDQMEEQDMLSLFNHHAFGDRDIPQELLDMEYLDMASKLVKKLTSPLEVIVVASRLRVREDPRSWVDVLRRHDHGYTTHHAEMKAMYSQMVPQLKRCFSFCGIFPKGYKHEAKNLVQLWVAQCFIKSTDAHRSAEDIGEEYFQELLSHFIFEPFRDEEIDPVQYIMDDSFHHLAELISSNDCSRWEDADDWRVLGFSPSFTYHLSVQWAYLSEYKWIIYQQHNLRTLILFGPPMDDSEASYKILEELFSHLKNLRALDISFYNGSVIPNTIGNLKHLRYLNLAATAVTKLPQSICKLYHLQFLKLSPQIKELPSNLRNMEGLQFV